MTVVVFGDDAAAVANDIEDADLPGVHASVTDDPDPPELDSAGGPDVVVPVGEASLLSLVRSGVWTPVLPVDIGQGIEDVARGNLPEAIRAIVNGEDSPVSIPTVEVRLDDDRYRALMDVMVVTGEAAKISEYRVTGRGHYSDAVLDTFRSDGVVVATPAGTPGYATAAGGPILGRAVDGVAVIPVGPFQVEQPHWVLDLPIEIRVVRKEVPVVLTVDDKEVFEVPVGEDIDLTWGDPFEILRTPVSRVGLRGP